MNENSAEVQQSDPVSLSREAIKSFTSGLVGLGVGTLSTMAGMSPEWSVGLGVGSAMGVSFLRDLRDRRVPPQTEHPFFTTLGIAGKMLMSGFIAWGATHMINIPEARQVLVQFGEEIKTVWQSAGDGSGEAATQVATQTPLPTGQDLEGVREIALQASKDAQFRRNLINTTVPPLIAAGAVSLAILTRLSRKTIAVPKSQLM